MWVGVGSRMSRGIDDRCTYTASSEMLHVHKLEKYEHTAYKVVSHLQLIMIMPYFPQNFQRCFNGLYTFTLLPTPLLMEF